jgi:hypothetical protein
VAQVGADGLVAAADVVADAGDGDVVTVGHGAADGLAVADVPVGAQHARGAVLGAHAALELRDRARLVVSDDLQGHAIHGSPCPWFESGERQLRWVEEAWAQGIAAFRRA